MLFVHNSFPSTDPVLKQYYQEVWTSSTGEFRTHLQVQSGLLILALHLQNIAKTLQTLGGPKWVAYDDEFGMYLLNTYR